MLEHLLASKNGLTQHFLLFCQVESFSPKTIRNYKEIITPFIVYCYNELGIEDTTQVTAFHIRSYLLSIKERLKPYSFYDYTRAIKRYSNWLVEERYCPLALWLDGSRRSYQRR
jgi:integrase/recombinase XerC